MERNNDFWVLEGTRDKLVDLLDGSWLPRAHAARVNDLSSLNPPHGELNFLWKSNPAEGPVLPNFIVGAPDALADLLSWAATYTRSLGPLTAQVRLMTPEWIRRILNEYERPYHLPGLERACAGLIMGEVSFLSRKIIPPEDISIAACHSTLAFAMLKACRFNLTENEFRELPALWQRVRAITDRKHIPIDTRPVANAVAILTQLSLDTNIRNSKFEVLSAIRQDRKPPLDALELLPREILGKMDLHGDFYALSAEDRVKVYDVIADSIALQPNLPNEEKGFFIALFATMCRPGAFEAIRLLSPFIEKLPDCALWYGIIQGLVSKNDALVSGNGLGWRIIRDMQVNGDPWKVPSYDIALSELEIYTRSRSGLRPIRSEIRSRIWVELLPGVSATFKVQEKESHEQGSLSLFTPFSVDQRTVEGIGKLRDIEKNLGRCIGMIKEVLGEEKPNNYPSKKPRKKRWRSP